MIYLTGAQVLDAAQTLSTDQTATFRTKMAVWMGMVGQDLSTRRKWNFLRTTQTLTITSNTITLPTDYLEVVDMVFSDNSYHTFVETATTMVFSPDVPDGTTVDLTYSAALTDMTDSATETILPYYCKTALVTGILSYLYTLDNEDNYAKFPAMYENEIAKLKVLDNRYSTIPTYEDIGYPVRSSSTSYTIETD